MRDLSLYFHIPYCKAKCHYCDFNSYTNKQDTIETYFNAVLKEIDLYKDYHGSKINTIFFGGGSPSFVDHRFIGLIIEKCRNVFEFSNDIEISIESNPENLTMDKLKGYKEMGINRISIGFQAWQDRLLKRIGRIHSNEQFLKAFNMAREAGFENINIDLMFSLPNQSLQDWKETLENIITLKPEHLSCYSLKVEEGTRFFEEYEKGTLDLPDEDVDREMYELANKMLKESAYDRYEISNFAKKGFECRHNLAYWTFKEYLGFGAGAHSFIYGFRFENVCRIEQYNTLIEKGEFAYQDRIELTIEDKISEYIITGLRLTKGINKGDFFSKFGVGIEEFYNEKIREFIKMGFLQDEEKSIRLTEKGFDVSNSVLCEFV